MAQTVKNLPAIQESRCDPWVEKIPWRKEWQPTPVFLPREFHGQRNLVGYSPWNCKESDMTERLTLSLFFRHSKAKFKINHESNSPEFHFLNCVEIKRMEYPNFLETKNTIKATLSSFVPHFHACLCLPSAGEYSFSKMHCEIEHRRRFRRGKQQGQTSHYRAGSRCQVKDLANEKNSECQQ